MAVMHCLMLCLWRERNNQSFKDTERTMFDIKLFFFRTLLDWMSVLHSHSKSLWFVSDLIDLYYLHD